eukprot:876477-Pelagomonas_calceolata.AAC.6
MHNTSKTGCCACPPGDSPPLFPRFRARFFFGWDLGVQQVGTGEAGMHGGTTPSGQAHRPALKTLDLAALTGSKEDGCVLQHTWLQQFDVTSQHHANNL